MAVENPFPYPGGKAYLAGWVLEYLPEHTCYIEPFAGSAATLFQKEPSHTELINDQDGDVTQFFVTLRDRHNELVSWLSRTPYSRDLHQKYAGQFYAGYRPDNDIERAGRFFYLRYTQYASKYKTKSGFSSAAGRNKANRLHNAAEKLHRFADRLSNVQIENRDYETMFSRFDREGSVFYCDPPYVDAGDALYSHGEFDHDRFVSVLEETESDWLVSYETLPASMVASDYNIVTRSRRQYMANGQDSAELHGEEKLVMNFDPQEKALHQVGNQQTLTEVV